MPQSSDVPTARVTRFPQEILMIMQALRSPVHQLYLLDHRRLLVVQQEIVQIMKKVKLHPRHCQIKCSTHTLVLADPNANIVLRIALTNIGKIYLKSNITSLLHTSLSNMPTLLDTSADSLGYRWSAETYISGDTITPPVTTCLENDIITTVSDWYKNQQLALVAQLPMNTMLEDRVHHSDRVEARQLYKVYKIRVSKRVEKLKICQIHGDLTHENIRIVDGKIYLFDFERSHRGCAEFDLWLLHLFSVAREHSLDHVQLYSLICKQDLAQMRKMLNSLYRRVPSLEETNARYLDILAYCFKAYIGILTMLELNKSDPSRIVYRDMVQKEIHSL